MDQIVIKDIQKVQLRMIKQIHNVCIESNIKYSIIGGTLLGAVRHKGFIPWDDDLDIALLRPDYDKLIALLKENAIDECFLQEYSTEKHYMQPYAKLRFRGTKYIEKFCEGVDINHGVFVDIFPLDKINNPNSINSKFRRLLSRCITFTIWRKEKCFINRKGIKKLEYICSSIIGIFPKKVLVSFQLMLVMRENKDWNYVTSMFSSNYHCNQQYFNLNDLENLVFLDFEDIKLYGIKEYNRYLTRLYNNYMKLPPEEKRNSGHNVIEIKI